MDYKVTWIAKYQTSRRRRGCYEMNEKEFNTKWEAEKFIHDWKREHWFADACWVEQKVTDVRNSFQKAYDARVHERVARYAAKHGL